VSEAGTPREIIDFFLDPASYDHEVGEVVHRQTHVSHLFFAGDYVYKLKKPVDMGFLDFSTLAKRRSAAVAEIKLNRRVAPDIYLDLVAVHRSDDGGLRFSSPTTVEEVAVLMRRLPDERRLSRLIERADADAAMLRNLGRLIADFHRRAASSPEIERFGSLETIRGNWEENFAQTEPYIDRTISRDAWMRCKEEIKRYMRVYADLFEQRVREGHIRDCHGDLQTDDTFIDETTGKVHVLDCIEFNERFRYSDTVSDIAFLSMDLRYRRADQLAAALLDAYYEHGDDEPIPSLLRFYECYRAYVRGKVRSFVADQPEVSAEDRAAATQEARRFFELSLADALRLRPQLVIVSGLMGSGKTRQSEELARRLGASVVHSDVVRKELAGIDPRDERKVPFGEGIYSSDWTERTYRALIDQARSELARGNSIVLDASWSNPGYRARAREAAREREALFIIVECTAPDDVLRSRLRRPSRSITDGRLELLDDQRSAYRAPEREEADRLVRVDTSGTFEEAADQAYQGVLG
jgi:aminoglycoside phosphotransferase family enzyme/predicted kinase